MLDLPGPRFVLAQPLLRLLFSLFGCHHAGFAAFRTFDAVLSVEAVSREETLAKTCLKMRAAIRTLKMVVGRFDRDSDHVHDDNQHHNDDDIHKCRHGISSLILFFVMKYQISLRV